MTITVGGHTLAVERSDATDAQLVAETGCSAAEHAAILARPATAYQIARVLAPLVQDGPAVNELAEMIEADDPDRVRFALVEVLAASPAEKE